MCDLYIQFGGNTVDWQEIVLLQDALVSLQDGPFVSMGALERDAGLRRGWCRNFIGGNPVRMRPRASEVEALTVTLGRLQEGVGGLDLPHAASPVNTMS